MKKEDILSLIKLLIISVTVIVAAIILGSYIKEGMELMGNSIGGGIGSGVAGGLSALRP